MKPVVLSCDTWRLKALSHATNHALNTFSQQRVTAITATLLIMLTALLTLTVTTSANAAAPAEVLADVQSLLIELERSNCQFQRNGTWHDAADARSHLQRKFDYLNRRNLADTVPLFIERAGTASSISGKAYAVRCPGEAEISGAAWLTQKWHNLRSNRKTP